MSERKQEPWEEVQAEEEELLGSVLHDLRTPLVAVQGFVRLLEVSTAAQPLQEKQLEYLEQIKQSTSGMKRVVERLQMARRLQRDRISPQPRPVSLAAFWDREVERHRELGRAEGVSVVKEESTASVPVAVFDPGLISEALGCLVEDAIHHTREGGQVREGMEAERNRIRFCVQDRGPSIAAPVLPRLFERFVQGRRREESGKGSGMALFVCRQIALLHQGRSWGENVPGGGVRLTLEIPLVPVTES